MPILHHAAFTSNMSWNGDLVMFTMVDDGRATRCAVTKDALAAISGRVLAHTLDMLNSFMLWRDEVEGFARAKTRAWPVRTHGRVVVTLDDIDAPPTGGCSAGTCPEAELLQAA